MMKPDLSSESTFAFSPILSRYFTFTMSSSDVRSILNLPHAPGPSQSSQQTRKANVLKRPDGISRELYALIGDNAPSLADAHASISAVKYRDRPKAKGPKAKWCVLGRHLCADL